MTWVLSQDAKPERYRLVEMRCAIGNGGTLQRDGFWTGFTWRVIGDKHKVDTTVIECSYFANRQLVGATPSVVRAC